MLLLLLLLLATCYIPAARHGANEAVADGSCCRLMLLSPLRSLMHCRVDECCWLITLAVINLNSHSLPIYIQDLLLLLLFCYISATFLAEMQQKCSRNFLLLFCYFFATCYITAARYSANEAIADGSCCRLMLLSPLRSLMHFRVDKCCWLITLAVINLNSHSLPIYIQGAA